ncbi:MAG TPA: hypothetical protein VHW09_32885 [Bryobacteraceae bacterium]|jgi:hypothetical protein|nr:hypothetical protein [Bryobacteraceae bacterium]
MLSSLKTRVLLAGVLGAASLLAQDTPLTNSQVRIDLPEDSPVAVMRNDTGTSRQIARGAAVVLDLNLSLTLRNISNNRIHGVTLRIVSQEVAMGGVGSVFQPGLNVGPGEAFPVHIATKLMRPMQMAGGPLLQVNLDGVLFQDLSFYGPDKLHSRRIMTASEMEAQRDRTSLKRLLAQGGAPALKDEILKILARRQALPQIQGRIVRGHVLTNAGLAAITPERERQETFAFVQFPDGPIQLIRGSAMIAGSDARTPTIDVANLTDRPVKYVELGWVLTDSNGRSYMAGSLPSSDPAFTLAARGMGKVTTDNTLEFSAAGKPLDIRKVTGFVDQVEFADGKVWVPSRRNMESDPLLMQVMEPSVEEERLANLYITKGLPALMDELKKY